MLLGEHEHTIDDKGRLTLPARFRQVLAEGVVVTRGMDGCLYAYAKAEWELLVEEVRRLLAVQPGDTVVDATFGAGGHSSLLAADLCGEGKLIAIDRDPEARTYFERFRRTTAAQARLLRGDFSIVLPQLADN